MDTRKRDARHEQHDRLKIVKASMLEELGVTLKDFLTNDSGHLIRISSGALVISARLRDALRSYALRRQITLVQSLERLRDEINRQSDSAAEITRPAIGPNRR